MPSYLVNSPSKSETDSTLVELSTGAFSTISLSILIPKSVNLPFLFIFLLKFFIKSNTCFPVSNLAFFIPKFCNQLFTEVFILDDTDSFTGIFSEPTISEKIVKYSWLAPGNNFPIIGFPCAFFSV